MVASLEEVEQKKSAASATKTKGKGTDTAAKKSQDLVSAHAKGMSEVSEQNSNLKECSLSFFDLCSCSTPLSSGEAETAFPSY